MTMERDLIELSIEWADAEGRNDVNTLDSLLSEDFVGVGPYGFMLTKDEWLDRYRNGDLQNESLTLGEQQARTFGDAGIVIGRESLKTEYKGQPQAMNLRTTLFCVKNGNGWQIAGMQHSPIPEGMPGRPA